MPETWNASMDQQRDLTDFREHPEWFEVRALRPDPFIVAELYKHANTTEMRRELAHQLINPPVCIKRKPVPFVLPIRGSAL